MAPPPAPTFLQSLPNLDGISRQVEVCVVGLQVADGTVSSRHTEALDEQLCRAERANSHMTGHRCAVAA